MSDPPPVVVRIAETRSPPTRLVTTAVMCTFWSIGLLCDVQANPAERGLIKDQAMGTICGALDLWSKNRGRDLCMCVTVEDFRLFHSQTGAEDVPGAKLVMTAWAGASIPLHFHLDIAPSPGLPAMYVKQWKLLAEELQQRLPPLPVQVNRELVLVSRTIADNVSDGIFQELA